MGCGAGAGANRYKLTVSESDSQGPRYSSSRTPTGLEVHTSPRSATKRTLVAEQKLIKDALRATCLCASCSAEELDELSADVDLFQFKEGEIVCQLDAPGTHFFVVSDGSFSEERVQSGPKALKRGSFFGELALLQDGTQKSTVVCTKDGTLWAVDGKTFRRVLTSLSSRHANENRQKLAQVSLFKGLSEEQRDLLVGCVLVHSYPKGAYVVREGEASDGVFIVKEGELKVSAKGKEIRRLVQGQYFGESALLQKETQSVTVVSLSSSTCLNIGRAQLQQVLRTETLERLLFNNFITTALTEAFRKLTRPQVEALAQAMEQENWAAGIVHGSREDEPRDLEQVRFMVVLKGAVEVSDLDAPDASRGLRRLSNRLLRLDRGHSFGQEYVLQPTLRFGHQVRCVEAAQVAVLRSEVINRVLGTLDLKQVAEDNEKMAALKSIYFFSVLSAGQLAVLARSFRVLPAKKTGEPVVAQGEAGETFYFIASGEVQVTIGDRAIRKMRRGEYFGERALLFSELRTASVTVSQDDTRIWAVDKQDVLPIVGDSMRSHLEYRCQLQDTSVAFSDLDVGMVLGKGNFGVVKEVAHSKTQTRYALKCILKSRIVKLEQIHNVQRERDILATADHPFIIKLVRTFKDETYIYFLTELLTGGELYELIRKLGIMDRAQAQFYFGCLALSIEYLHSRSVCFRDLKPENVMLTTRGYTKLIDFGCARKMAGQRSFSLVGTPHYMAPEVVLGKGYKLTADLWSLGVCLFEFLCGPLPFAPDADDKLEIFKAILMGQFVFRDGFQDSQGQDLINQLLCKNPSARIGCSLRGFDDVREHQFYDGFEWEKLLSMDIQPPHVPKSDTPKSHVRKSLTFNWSEAGNVADEDEQMVPKVMQTTWDESF